MLLFIYSTIKIKRQNFNNKKYFAHCIKIKEYNIPNISSAKYPFHLPGIPLGFLRACSSSMVDPPRLEPAMLSLSTSV